jgi:hypothetical protein
MNTGTGTRRAFFPAGEGLVLPPYLAFQPEVGRAQRALCEHREPSVAREHKAR